MTLTVSPRAPARDYGVRGGSRFSGGDAGVGDESTQDLRRLGVGGLAIQQALPAAHRQGGLAPLHGGKCTKPQGLGVLGIQL